ncbi:MAG: hypothetical protein H6618_09345 [Deltaproteobacteria bacterium]|nr:hypothetical protein [Deltaproteobacteria bacterium]
MGNKLVDLLAQNKRSLEPRQLYICNDNPNREDRGNLIATADAFEACPKGSSSCNEMQQLITKRTNLKNIRCELVIYAVRGKAKRAYHNSCTQYPTANENKGEVCGIAGILSGIKTSVTASDSVYYLCHSSDSFDQMTSISPEELNDILYSATTGQKSLSLTISQYNSEGYAQESPGVKSDEYQFIDGPAGIPLATIVLVSAGSVTVIYGVNISQIREWKNKKKTIPKLIEVDRREKLKIEGTFKEETRNAFEAFKAGILDGTMKTTNKAYISLNALFEEEITRKAKKFKVSPEETRGYSTFIALSNKSINDYRILFENDKNININDFFSEIGAKELAEKERNYVEVTNKEQDNKNVEINKKNAKTTAEWKAKTTVNLKGVAYAAGGAVLVATAVAFPLDDKTNPSDEDLNSFRQSLNNDLREYINTQIEIREIENKIMKLIKEESSASAK